MLPSLKHESSLKVLVIGGGAAGFFTAINIAEKNPSHEVTILEKSSKLLSKVKISGGGRCNVTNARNKPSELIHFYPRGHKKLHSLFKTFSTNHMVEWLADHGVATKTEADLRMFPTSDSSQTVIDCFVKVAKKLAVKVLLNEGMIDLTKIDDQWAVKTNSSEFRADAVVIATGSSPALWKKLEQMQLSLTSAVPSLFTFNISDPRIHDLPGVSFERTMVTVIGSKLKEDGPLLITHWGISGPAVLKLSSWGARHLSDCNYSFQILINFTGKDNREIIQQQLSAYKSSHPKRKVHNYPLFGLPKRFWERMADYCGISANDILSELSKKKTNKLLEELTQGRYQVNGKSTFKEEFVTSGGIKLNEINLETFESKKHKNLYLAGEVLDIDALTGGFNFQACWSAGWVISEALSKNSNN